MIKGDKVEVELDVMDEGTYPGETLRFYGELVDSYERGDTRVELYECPHGYRVYVDNGSGELGCYLHPSVVKPYTGELEYQRLYTAEEVAEKWPEFGSSVDVLRVRDID